MIFEYQAKDRLGKDVRGVVEAPSLQLAADILKEKNFVIIFLKEKRKRVVFVSSFHFFGRIPIREIVIFSRQLAVMINSGVPLVRSLRILVGQTVNINFKVIIADIADEVEGGAKLSTSLGRYPRTFDNFFVQMIRSGETTGKLDEALNYLADQKEKDYDFNNRIRGAMTYPVFVLLSLFSVGAVMMIYVIPRLTTVLEEASTELPWSTRALIAVSGFFQGYWWLMLLVFVGLVIFLIFYRQTPVGRKAVDVIKIHLPIVGGIFKRVYLTRMGRSLSTLLGSGIPLSHCLPIVADIVGNMVYKEVILQAAQQVEQGNSVAAAFLDSKDVPIMVPQMMRIGEQTGKLDQVLAKISDFYARETENMISNLVTLVEPVIMILLGLGVGILVSAVLLPMYNLSTAL